MPAPWIVTKPAPAVEEVATQVAPKSKPAAPTSTTKKTRKKTSSTTTKSSEK